MHARHSCMHRMLPMPKHGHPSPLKAPSESCHSRSLCCLLPSHQRFRSQPAGEDAPAVGSSEAVAAASLLPTRSLKGLLLVASSLPAAASLMPPRPTLSPKGPSPPAASTLATAASPLPQRPNLRPKGAPSSLAAAASLPPPRPTLSPKGAPPAACWGSPPLTSGCL